MKDSRGYLSHEIISKHVYFLCPVGYSEVRATTEVSHIDYMEVSHIDYTELAHI